jgi:hypothetical protein
MTTHVVVLPGGGYSSHAAHEAEPIVDWLETLGYGASVFRYPPERATSAAAGRRPGRNRGPSPRGRHPCRCRWVLGGRPSGRSCGAGARLQRRPAPRLRRARLSDHLDGTGHVPRGPRHPAWRLPTQRARWEVSLDRLVTPSAPPMFLWHTAEDVYVYPEHSYRLAAALSAAHMPCTCSPTARTAWGWPRAPGRPNSGRRWPQHGWPTSQPERLCGAREHRLAGHRGPGSIGVLPWYDAVHDGTEIASGRK